MKILALDSSGIVASVAVVEDDTLLAEYTVNYKKTHSQTLLPMLDEIVKMTELELESVDAIAVAAGPGSFTGLRIGSATAKGLGLALKKPLVAVPTVDALAYNLYDAQGLICPIMDARRKQVYTGIYRFEEHQLMTLREQWAAPIEELLEDLDQVMEIEQDLFHVPWTKEGFFTFLTRDDAMFLVVEEKEKILGYCGLLMVLDEGDITNVAVRRDRQKEGIGAFLMQSLIRLAAEREVTTIHLEVRVGNETAIRLYERMGFTGDGIRKAYYSDPVEDALLMTRHPE